MEKVLKYSNIMLSLLMISKNRKNKSVGTPVAVVLADKLVSARMQLKRREIQIIGSIDKFDLEYV